MQDLIRWRDGSYQQQTAICELEGYTSPYEAVRLSMFKPWRAWWYFYGMEVQS